MPRVAGQGRPGHVALTFDDGPDQLSTPRFLRILEARGVHATFFLLGSQLARNRSLAKEMAAAGHELAIHGWDHRPLLLRGPRATREDLARACDLLGETTGQAPRWFRPPYGVMSTSARLACRKVGLTPVLWTTWGQHWRSRAAPRTLYDTAAPDPAGGSTILLHDADTASAVGSWKPDLHALPALLDACEQRGLAVGPLRDHQPSHPATDESTMTLQHDLSQRR
ncbi:polysaccharide deacetylase family protein [Streptacidiphilus sp. MAP12-20]|uniref:polysaccharide deacetylase family protein n=1 Tax=Streptacidiphilus sp. MAP12-20 TaxID=3156299 RepID=UPI003514A79C